MFLFIYKFQIIVFLPLLIIAVMFTFSFSTAMAANDATTVSDRTAALAKITEKFDGEVAKLDKQLAVVKAADHAGSSDADWAAACQKAYETVKADLDKQLAEAYQVFGEKEQKASEYEYGILGYDYGTNGGDGSTDGYVYFKEALDKIDLTKISGNKYWTGTAFKDVNTIVGDIAYDTLLAKTKELIKNYNIEQFVKDDKVEFEGKTKSSYEWAVIAQNDALAYLGAFKDNGDSVTIGGQSVTCNETSVKAVYEVKNEGTVGESYSGSFYDEKSGVHPSLATLRTEHVITTDAAKIDYAKNKSIAAVKAAIEKQRAVELDKENETIFAQSVLAKPNQVIIDKAKENIEEINKKYDAMVKVWEYRLTNAEYKVVKESGQEKVNAFYNDADYNSKINTSNDSIGYFKNGVYTPSGMYAGGLEFSEVKGILNAEKALEILDLIADLEKDAEILKATVYVDGAMALAVDEALADAVKDAYMLGKADLSVATDDTIVHINAHKLLGTKCSNHSVNENAKVTIGDKEYDTVVNWTTDGYSENNTAAVKAIIDDAKKAIKSAESVDAANKAFLDAYEKYDAVLTKAEQKALFNYNGPLYQKDTAAKAELAAYIEYKVKLLDDNAPADNTADKVKEYFGIEGSAAKEDFLAEVVDEASLKAAIADVKAKVDTLKTKNEMKAEGEALAKEVAAVKRPVTLAQKDSVLALYDKLVDYDDYCTMVGYTNGITSNQELLKTDVQRLEDLELAELAAAKKALGDLNKLTLDKEAAVKAFVDAQKAYNDLYGVEGKYKDVITVAKDYEEADDYDVMIFLLKVEAATNLIKALPVNPTVAQVVAAQEAVDALGFEGICAIPDRWLTKLDKFDQDASENEIARVKSMKLRAYSKYGTKGITVKWVIKDGRKSDAAGYQVYRSTKANRGYKKLITVKGFGVKNVKNLKKGTVYYYKVRAYKRVDGKLYFSDWSNKAYRRAK